MRTFDGELTGELKSLRAKYDAGDLIDADGGKALKAAVWSELEESDVMKPTFKKSIRSVLSDEKEKEGTMAILKMLVDRKAIKKAQMEGYDKVIDKEAESIFKDMLTTKHTLDLLDSTGGSSKAFLNFHREIWDEMQKEGGTKTVAVYMMNERVIPLSMAMTVGRGLDDKTRTVLVASAFIGAMVAMMSDADIDEYKACGTSATFPIYRINKHSAPPLQEFRPFYISI